jgi:hypothetical protein
MCEDSKTHGISSFSALYAFGRKGGSALMDSKKGATQSSAFGSKPTFKQAVRDTQFPKWKANFQDFPERSS